LLSYFPNVTITVREVLLSPALYFFSLQKNNNAKEVQQKTGDIIVQPFPVLYFTEFFNRRILR
jgi:hypothetical protein